MTLDAATTALDETLKVFGNDWRDPKVEDFFIVRPGEYFVRRGGNTERREAPGLDAATVEAIGLLAGHLRGQYADTGRPILDCELPSGERLNMVLPPCAPPGRPSMALRRGLDELTNLENLDAEGLWDAVRDRAASQSTDYHTERMNQARQMIDVGRFTETLKFAVQNRWSICFVGETGSGKSTNLGAVIMEIPQTPNERIVTIGDSEELKRIPHPNVASFLFSKNDSRVTCEMLIEAALRNLPRWTIVQELRDKAAFAFLRGLIVSPGLTTWHATSIDKAFDALTVMILQHEAGRAIPVKTLREMMRTLINIVVHVERDPVTKKFRATDIKLGSDLA